MVSRRSVCNSDDGDSDGRRREAREVAIMMIRFEDEDDCFFLCWRCLMNFITMIIDHYHDRVAQSAVAQ